MSMIWRSRRLRLRCPSLRIVRMLQKQQSVAKVALPPAPVKGEYNIICPPQPLFAASHSTPGASWRTTSPWCCGAPSCALRSEEHTSELQSLRHLVCRLLLEKKKTQH